MSSIYRRALGVCLVSASLACGQLAIAAEPAPQADSARSDAAVPAGGPLSESEIIILLQAKVPLEVISKFVTIRGVNFVSTKDSSKRIMSSGGDVSLIGTVNLNQKEDAVIAQADTGTKKRK
ncbi:MAG: hypothetical protein ABJF23_02130 [Bryobacteraceae bacterium]